MLLSTNLMEENKSWVSPLMEDMTMQDYYDFIPPYGEKKDRSGMQTKERTEPDNEIAEKHRKANIENGNIIVSGMAYLVGKGKFSEMEKENKRLKSELPKLITLQKKQFNTGVDNQVAKEVTSQTKTTLNRQQ